MSTILNMTYPAPGPTWGERIVRLLKRGTVYGQTSMLRALRVPADQLALFNSALNAQIFYGVVQETKSQVPGTGREGPPVYEYTYTLGRQP